MNNDPLISVLVTCYNNQNYIYENLQSIFSQTYPNIEVVIGDDASQAFDEKQLWDWIEKNRTPNISDISIYVNSKNMGTVTNLENLQQHSHGEFLYNIAADDALYSERTLELLFAKASEVGDDALVIIAQTEMWDETLAEKLDDFISPESVLFIQSATPRALFAANACRVILPASYLYRRTVLEKVGKLSCDYHLVEDVPTLLRLLRQDVKIHYSSAEPSLKHRDGGISHGNSRQSQKVQLMYYRDAVRLYALEIRPFFPLLSKAERRAARIQQCKRRIVFLLVQLGMSSVIALHHRLKGKMT